MTSPLEGSLAKTINAAMQNLFISATLIRDEAVVTSPAPEPWEPQSTAEVEYTCKAIVEMYSQRLRAEGLVDMNDRKVLILAQSLEVTPVPGNRVTVRGITFTIIDVATDPALAVWECKGRMQ